MSLNNIALRSNAISSADEMIEHLKSKLDRTVPIEAGTKAYALLDFPNYQNVGDSLIWLGAAKFLRDHYGARPQYVCTVEHFDPKALARALPDGPIYLSGGGNFGDLWPKFQNFRFEVLRNFPDRQIIQLPQTIHFSDERNVSHTREAIMRHANFTLLVRDIPSQQFASSALNCDAILAPDMAFWLGSIPRRYSPHFDYAVMLREDKERSQARGQLILPEGTSTSNFDWIFGSEESFASQVWSRATREQAWLGRYHYFQRRAEYQLDRGMKLLCSGKTVITDRLHGHILSVLLGIPHVVLDNSYGKVKNFFDLWTKDWAGCVLSESLEGANEAVAQLKMYPSIQRRSTHHD